jgi:hypothetical protein
MMRMFHPILLAAVSILGFCALSLHAEDATKPGAGEFKDLKQVTAEVPHDVLIGLMNYSGREAAAAKGMDVLREKVEGHTATLKFKVDRVEKEEVHDQAPQAYRIKAEDAHVRQGAVNFKVYLWVHFSASESAKVSAMKKGEEVTATGKVTVAALHAPKEPEINIDISDSTVN